MSRRGAAAIALLAAVVAGCSNGSGTPAAGPQPTPGGSASTSTGATPSPTPSPTPTPKPTPTLPPPQGAPANWVTTVAHGTRPEVQVQTVTANGATVVVMRMDGPSTRLFLHAGYDDPGGQGWITGPSISEAEKPKLLAAFNGGFKLGLGLGGFMVLGRQVGAIQPGLASIVTYADGSSGLGAWGRDVPARGKRVISVRQNLSLLVDQGLPAADIDAYQPWGATLGGGFAVPRSGLGIDRFGNLLWAGSSYATPRTIATALIQSGAVRAMQLDINPMWVCAFTFQHGPAGLTQSVVLPTQYRPVGTYLEPYGRDYFVVGLR